MSRPPIPDLSIEFFQDVLQQTSDMIFVLDGTAAIRRCFGAAHGFYREEELLGRNIFEIVHPDDHQAIVRNFEAITSGKAFEPFLLRGRRKDGSHRWFEVIATTWIEEAGERWALILNRDVHERKLAEDTLVESERRYRALVDQSPLGILVVDRQLNLISANDAYVRQVGAPNRESLQGHNLLDSPAIDEAGPDRLFERLRVEGTISTELSYRSLFDKRVEVHVNVSAIRDDDGEFVGAQMVFEDISERRRLEEQLRHSQKMEAVGRLAGGVAHDFNNNLTVILGLAEYLAEDPLLGDEVRKTAAEIAREAERSAALTGQLLAFSRPTAPDLEPVDVASVVERLEPMLSRALGEFIELRTRRASASPIAANAMLLEQAIVNLAMNARDAMRDGGHLQINVDMFEGDVLLEVADDGVGMDAETTRRCFEPFFTTKQASRGTGLGLTMAYGIVQQFGGEIRVESEPAAGTRFELRFPALQRAGDERPAHDRRARQRSAGGNRILVLEDQTPVRRLLRDVLEREGYDVLSASTSAEALELARAAEPPIDLLLSDVRLPERSGPETAAILCAEFPDLRVLYVSGYNDAAVDADGRMAGDRNEVLSKPFTSRRLLERIRATLGDARRTD